jgi:autotransporter translocation and assembly factor TamB
VRLATGLTVLLTVTAIAALVLLDSHWGREQARWRLQRLIDQQLHGGRLELGPIARLRPDLIKLESATLRGPAALSGAAGERLAELRGLEVVTGLRPVLPFVTDLLRHRHWRIPRVSIARLEASSLAPALRQLRFGSGASSPPPSPGSLRPVGITVDEVRVLAALDVPGAKSDPLRLSAQLELPRDAADHGQLQLRTQGATLRARGGRQPGDPLRFAADLDLQAPAGSLAEARQRAGVELIDDLGLHLGLRGDGPALRAEAQLSAGATHLALQATGHQQTRQATVALTAKHLRPQRFLPRLPAADVNLRLEAEGGGRTGAERGTVTLTVGESRLDDAARGLVVHLQRGLLRAEVDRRRAHITRGELELDAGQARLSGEVGLTTDAAVDVEAVLDLWRMERLPAAPRGLGGELHARLAARGTRRQAHLGWSARGYSMHAGEAAVGVLNSEGEVVTPLVGPPGQLLAAARGALRLEADGLKLGNRRARQARLRVRLRDDGIALSGHHEDARGLRTTVQLLAQPSPGLDSVNLRELEVRAIDRSNVPRKRAVLVTGWKLLRPALLARAGSGPRARYRVSGLALGHVGPGRRDRLSVNGDVDARAVGELELAISSLDVGDLLASARRLGMSGAAAPLDGRLQATLRYRRERADQLPQLAGELEVDRAGGLGWQDLRLRGQVGFDTGTGLKLWMEGSLRGRRVLHLDSAVSVEPARWREALTATGAARGRVPGTVLARRLRPLAGAQLHGQLRVWNIGLTDVPEAVRRRLIAPRAHAALGKLDVSMTLEGTLQRPRLALGVWASGAGWGDTQDVSLHTEVRLAPADGATALAANAPVASLAEVPLQLSGRIDIGHHNQTVLRGQLALRQTRPGARGTPWQSPWAVAVRVTGPPSLPGALLIDAQLGDWASRPLQRAPLTGTLRLDGFRIGALRPYLADATRLEGRIDGRLDFTGTVGRPELRGQVALRDGVLGSTATGQVYRDMALTLDVQRDRITLSKLTVKAGQGTLSGKGEVQLSGWKPSRFRLDLDARDFAAMSNSEIQAFVNAALSLRGSWDSPRLTGEVVVDRAQITIPSEKKKKLEPVGPLEDITFVGPRQAEREKRAAEKAAGPHLVARVRLRVPRHFRIKGKDVTAEIKADLLAEVNGDKFSLRGAAETVRGRFFTLGKEFKVESARVTFTGDDVEDPQLDVVATYSVNDYLVTAHITGTARKPALNLESEPAVGDQTAILGLIMTGSADFKGNDDRSMTNKAAGLVAGYAAGKVKDQLSKVVPFDVLRVDTGTNTQTGGLESRVEVGTYVTSDVYVSYAHRWGGRPEENSNEASLEYRFKPRWSVETRYGDAGEGALDVFWTYRY